MAKCELQVVLEGEATVFQPGDSVRGRVDVRSDDGSRCDGLSVELVWHTHGKGNTASGSIANATLFQGEWGPGTTTSYPFAFTLPQGPYTYHGELLNVDWAVRARADVPWAIDPKAEAELSLAPRPDAEPAWEALLPDPGAGSSKLRNLAGPAPGAPATITLGKGPAGMFAVGCVVVVALFVLGFFAGPLLAFATRVVAFARGEIQGSELAIEALGFLPFLAIGGVILGFALRKPLARRRLGEIKVQVEPARLRPGQDLRVQVTALPRGGGELARATATLRAQEVVTRGSGTNRKTYRHTIHEETFELPTPGTFSPGMPIQIGTSFKLPAGAPPSFAARDNQLAWTVELHLDLPRWPDWKHSESLLVHP